MALVADESKPLPRLQEHRPEMLEQTSLELTLGDIRAEPQEIEGVG